MHYLVYLVTNKTNGKIYIGTHITDNIDDGYLGSGRIIKRAVAKYGVDSFIKEILFDFSSPEEMFNKEKELVNSEFLMRMDTYNIVEGGTGGWDFVNSTGRNLYGRNGENLKAQKHLADIARKKKLADPEWKRDYCKRISEGLKKTYETRIHPWVGRTHSDNTKSIISKKNKISQKGNRNSQFGTYWIHHPSTKKNAKIKKDDIIPDGWIKGRVCKL